MEPEGLITDQFSSFFDSKINIRFPYGETEVEKTVMISIFIQQEDDQLSAVGLRLYDDDDLQFLYESRYTEEEFNTMKENQGLEIEYEDFPNVIREVITEISQDAGNQLAYTIRFVTSADNENSASLVISQSLDFCETDIFEFDFHKCTFDKIAAVAQKRYDEIATKAKNAFIELKDAHKRIQRQDPKAIHSFKLPSEK